MLRRYCITCHNEGLKTAGLMLDKADVGRVTDAPETWEKVVRKLRSGVMPPAGLPRPDKATSNAFASALEATLDRAAAVHPNPGRTPALHRLNRAEYHNAIRDVLGIDVDVAALLPSDSGSYGFDNIAGVLSISPALMESYISAAQTVSAVAVGAFAPPTSETFRVAGDLLQDDRMSGLPFGTRGGTSIHYTFPQDGEYEFRLRLGRNQTDDIAGLAEPSEIEVDIDDARVQSFTVGGRRRAIGQSRAAGQGGQAAAAPPPEPPADAKLHFRVPVKAGAREVDVTFIKRTSAYVESQIQPYIRVDVGQGGDTRYQPYLSSVVIMGPFNPAGPGKTSSREQIFVCYPTTPAAEEPCARRILSTLERRAYRRPVRDTDLQVLLKMYAENRRAGGSFDYAIEVALERLLVDPEFLFRVERDPPSVAPDTAYRLTDLELASRLSFFLWSTGPDDQLLDLAASGKLKDPLVLERQVRRMLVDRRSMALTTNFAGQWLYLRNVESLAPNDKLFPDFDESLRQALRRETELFFDSIVHEDRNVLDFLSANYTFVNERLAKHYGIPNVYGTDFRRVSVTDGIRGGLLGQASILAATSEATRTSPVRRGKWVLENLLGAPPPAPPPNVPALKDNEAGSTKVLSMREQMEAHRKNPACASCHRIMDPIGFALENFDAIGRWRTNDPWMLTVEDQKWRQNQADAPIDGTGTLPDGTPFAGPIGLKRALLDHPQAFVETLTEKLMTYALGRGVEYYDRPAVRKIVREAAMSDNRFSSLILGIVRSTPFQMRMSESPIDSENRKRASALRRGGRS